MKKAVIRTGGKQYVVSEGETIKVERIKALGQDKPAPAKDAAKAKSAPQKIDFEALMVIDGDNVQIGTPIVAKSKVTAEVVEADIQDDKVTSIRYKSKKRVRKVRGHRQHQTVLRINKIA